MAKFETKYKILTWNILHGHHYLERLPKIAQLIKQLGSQIVLLQEVDVQHQAKTIETLASYGYAVKLRPCPVKTSPQTVGIAYDSAAFREIPCTAPLDAPFDAWSLDLAPLTKLPLRQTEPTYITNGSHHPDTPLDYGNDILTVISYHGRWGTFEQPARLDEIVQIDRFAKAKGNAIILGGDFNALPNEPAIQYLNGSLIVDHQATLWVEAQDIITSLGGPQPHGTSFTHGQVADNSGRQFDLHRTPERRIDYLFNFGFSYGRQYSFDGWSYGINLDEIRKLSDHAPLLMGILDVA